MLRLNVGTFDELHRRRPEPGVAYRSTLRVSRLELVPSTSDLNPAADGGFSKEGGSRTVHYVYVYRNDQRRVVYVGRGRSISRASRTWAAATNPGCRSSSRPAGSW